MFEQMSIVVVAEKPSVARDIAKVLGAGARRQGYIEGKGYRVTWALGHLVTLAQPHEIKPQWKRWRRDQLPMLPASWPLTVLERTRDQYEIVKTLMSGEDVEYVVEATDAGREGELIFRYIYDRCGCDRPVRRLWISSLTPDAIKKGFAGLADGAEYERLAAAARGRSQADWLVGMNLSRAYTLGTSDDELFSVGRVQTPTLSMLVDREVAIREFVPQKFIEVVATFQPEGSEATYPGTWFKGKGKGKTPTRLPPDGEEAGAVAERAQRGSASIEKVKREKKRHKAPLLYDLTELQRHANRLYGLSADKTLKLAQALYEKHKLISYPRTDSRHLSKDVAATLGNVVKAVAAPYRDLLAPGTGDKPLGKRFVDDKKVTDHHAIIPTTGSIQGKSLAREEKLIYDLVCRRLLAAWHPDHVTATTTVITRIDAPEGETWKPDRYRSSGTSVEDEGWKVMEPLAVVRKKEKGKKKKAEQLLPGGLSEGQPAKVLGTEQRPGETRPPRPFTEGTLLTAMETAGKALDDKELSDAMRERGLGTPATRASIIETLLHRKYIERQKKTLRATPKGERLIRQVHEEVKSPAMTGQWEHRLKLIEQGKDELDGFMEDIEAYVKRVVGSVLKPGGGGSRAGERGPSPSPSPPAREGTRVQGPDGRGRGRGQEARSMQQVLKETFRHDSFRPHQETVCKKVIAGEDVLLVMPTGAGKSLCYQLPGLCRQATTLVVSPLIALMEDQVAALQAIGLRAERIHSGRDRLASRQVCRRFLDNDLDFLFIAPERLAVPGFPEFLAKRKLGLIAVDEAHCISQWGHDFRPEYRMLGERLPMLRPAPVIGLTATATPAVQDDIAEQLGLKHDNRHIHGFRRTNIAIEAAELSPRLRPAAVRKVLESEDRLPAIVYSPTRKKTEALAADLSNGFRAAPYHAGMTAEKRDACQAAFIAGELDVVVATIAFGMGIDKANLRTVIHAALPGSVEGYYQEIGRAGRDGKPSRAVLLYSYADRRTHEFFFQRDYPEPEELGHLFEMIDDNPRPAEAIRRRLNWDDEPFQTALEKLWIHGGARVDPEENVTRGEAGWRRPYRKQREHRQEQLEKIYRYAEQPACRMLTLVNYFGDREDSGETCGVCDACAPGDGLLTSFRAASADELIGMERILDALRRQDDQSAGKLHREELSDLGERHDFEDLVSGLERAGLLTRVEDSFSKGGQQIPFTRLRLTADGANPGQSMLADAVKMPGDTSAFEPKKPRRRRGGKKKRKKDALDEIEAPAALVEALRQWRLDEAKRRNTPAFRVLTNKTLGNIAALQPTSEEDLLAVPGMGPGLLKKYGEAILKVIEDSM